jgi:hypothetical protein
MKRYQYYYLDIPLPPSASAQTHPQGGIPSTSMQLQFCNVAFLIAAYYKYYTSPKMCIESEKPGGLYFE